MKAIVLLLMFGISSFSGLYYGYILSARERTLKELSGFLKYLVIKISTKSGTLNEFIKDYKGGSYIKSFLADLTVLLKGGFAYPFETAAQSLFALNEQDLSKLCSANIGILDCDEQIKVLENAICYFDEEVKKLQKTDKRRYIVSYSGVLAGLFLVVIFI